MHTSSINHSDRFGSPFPLNIVDHVVADLAATLNRPAKQQAPIQTGIGRNNATALAARTHIQEHDGEFNPRILRDIGIDLGTTHAQTSTNQLSAEQLTDYHTKVTNPANYQGADQAALLREITYNLNPLFILAKEGDSHAAKLLLTSVLRAKKSGDRGFSRLIRGVAGHMLMELATTTIQDKRQEGGKEENGLQMLLGIINDHGIGNKNRSFNPLQLLGGLNLATTSGGGSSSQIH